MLEIATTGLGAQAQIQQQLAQGDRSCCQCQVEVGPGQAAQATQWPLLCTGQRQVACQMYTETAQVQQLALL